MMTTGLTAGILEMINSDDTLSISDSLHDGGHTPQVTWVASP